VARSATGVVRVAAIQLLPWIWRHRSNLPRRGLWPWLPLNQEGEALVPRFATETT
jgi:hypothetical protein